jgi:hypothetical protein
VLTYYPAVFLVPVIVAWVVVSGRWRLLFQMRTISTAAVCGVVLLPSMVIALKWARLQVEMTATPGNFLSRPDEWVAYVNSIQWIFGTVPLVLAGLNGIS